MVKRTGRLTSIFLSMLLIISMSSAAFAEPGAVTGRDIYYGVDSDREAEKYGYDKHEMVAVFETDVDEGEVLAVVSQYGLQVKEPYDALELDGISYVLSIPEGASLAETMLAVFCDDRVKYVFPNLPVSKNQNPTPKDKQTTPKDYSSYIPDVDYVDGEVFVCVDMSVPDIPFAYRVLEDYGCVITSILSFGDKWEGSKGFSATITDGRTVTEACNAIDESPFVWYVGPNGIYHAFEGETYEERPKDDHRWDDLVPGEDYVENEVMVTFIRRTPDIETIEVTAAKYGCSVKEVLSFSDKWEAGKVAIFTVEDGESVPETIRQLEGNLRVADAMPNLIYHSFDGYGLELISDPSSYEQWYIEQVGLDEAWNYAACDNEITVAVLDSQIDLDHEDLADNIHTDLAWSAIPDDAPQSPDTITHGTFVAGIISAVTGNGLGYDGASYNANILPITIMPSDNDMLERDLYNGLQHILNDIDYEDINLKVINLSLGSYIDYTEYPIRLTLQQLDSLGILVVCAAGNANTDASAYPSDYDSVVSVMATDQYDEKTTFSDYGEQKDICAPGVDIASTVTDDLYGSWAGTSFSAPIVSGTAALMFAANPDLDTAQAKYILYSTAKDLGSTSFDSTYGWGRLDAKAAVIRAKEGIWERIPGTNRYFTTQNISRKGWEDGSCDTVVLALGTDFPDALAGTAFAGIHDCPVLLTPGTALAPQAAAEIERLGASTVYIVGGSGVITDTVKASVEALTGVQQVIRLAGNNRYDTAYEIYEEGIGEWSDTLIVATGMDFADALAIAPYASASRSPIFLTNAQGGMTSAMQAAIIGGAFDKAVIVGGTGIVPASTENFLKGALGNADVIRLAGSNRYETSSLVSNWASGEMNSTVQPETVLDYANVSLVNAADDFADALPGAAFAGHLGSVMLITQNVASGLNYTVQHNVIPHIDDIDLGYIIGGTGVLSDAFETYLESLAS